MFKFGKLVNVTKIKLENISPNVNKAGEIIT